jgi:hypothetical protein
MQISGQHKRAASRSIGDLASFPLIKQEIAQMNLQVFDLKFSLFVFSVPSLILRKLLQDRLSQEHIN